MNRARRDTLLIGFGGLIAATITLAPAAHANPASFLATVRGLGFNGTDEALLHNGHAVCAKIDGDSNVNGEDVAEAIVANISGATLTGARSFVIASVDEFCPAFDHNGDTSV
jgi:hypothetical protein